MVKNNVVYKMKMACFYWILCRGFPPTCNLKIFSQKLFSSTEETLSFPVICRMFVGRLFLYDLPPITVDLHLGRIGSLGIGKLAIRFEICLPMKAIILFVNHSLDNTSSAQCNWIYGRGPHSKTQSWRSERVTS